MNIFWDRRFEPEYARHPLTLVDVGARGGIQDRWSLAQGHFKVIGFEPEPEEHRRLTATASPHQVFLNAALLDRVGLVDLFVTRAPGRSSVYEPNFPLLEQFFDPGMLKGFEVARKISVPVDTLDNQLGKHGLGPVDFIKLDTQGAELPILCGAQGALKKSVIGMEIEVEFLPLYRNQPLFDQVMGFACEHGFELVDLLPRFVKRVRGREFGRRKGQLVYGDALFLRPPSAVLSLAEAWGDRQGARAVLLKAMSIGAVYGYLDYAADILSLSAKHFTEDEKRIILGSLRRDTPAWTNLPPFAGRSRVARLFYKLFRILYPAPTADPKSGVTMSGYFIGNSDY